jgi:hypothetical protein
MHVYTFSSALLFADKPVGGGGGGVGGGGERERERERVMAAVVFCYSGG